MSSEAIVDLPEDLKKLVFEEFGETVESIQSALESLRAKLPEAIPAGLLEKFDQTDENLLRFLRGKKFRVEKTIDVIHNYIKFRDQHPDWFTVTKEEVELFMNLIKVSPTLDTNLRRTVMIIPCAGLGHASDEFLREHPQALTRFRMWLFDKLSWDPYAQLAGVVVVASFQNLSFWDSRKLSGASTIYEHVESIRFATKCSGFRLKALLLFEEPFFFTFVWAGASLIMSEKIKSRFRLCGRNYAELTNHFPSLDHLPACLGGTESDDLRENNWISQACAESFPA